MALPKARTVVRNLPPASPEVGPDSFLWNEEALLERLLAGDEEAFSYVVRTYSAPMTRVARRFVPSSAVAEEVVQDSWLAVLTGLSRFEGRSSLKTWIFQILINQAKYHGNRQRRLWRLERPADSGTPASPDTDPATVAACGTPAGMCDEVAQRIILDEVMASVWASIATLPRRQARVISLRDISGLSAADVCQELGLSDDNQRALLHRARKRVRHDLERLGHKGE
jgi:RNA polymerase sigma-70 factor (ECF subfamily)